MPCNCGKKRSGERWVPRSRRAPVEAAPAGEPQATHRIVSGSEQAAEIRAGRPGQPPRAKQPTA